jgi:hypothetical protein
VQLADELPAIRVPLAAGDEDVSLDLQAVFTRFYDENAYGRRIAYEEEATPPLAGSEATWARDLLSRAQDHGR